jgi:hypothetical protein
VSYQNFFRAYPKLSGMSGTASTEIDEFSNIYNMSVQVCCLTTDLIARRSWSLHGVHHIEWALVSARMALHGAGFDHERSQLAADLITTMPNVRAR